MSASTAFKCPNCGVRLRIDQPLAAPARAHCKGCDQQILVPAAVAPEGMQKSDELEDFRHLPKPTKVAGQVSTPATSRRVVRRAARRAHARANHETSRRIWRKRLAFYATLSSCLVALGIAATVAYGLLRDVPSEQWAELVPGIDTPEKLVRQYEDLCEDFRQACASIDSKSTRDRAIPRILSINAALRGIPDRVSELGPPTPLQLDSLGESWTAHLEQLAAQSHEQITDARSKRTLVNGDLVMALKKHDTALDEAAKSMITAWQPES